ncbi:MAG: hypothetical protein KZQ84_18580, partial [Candidatus Thiodiazotropha sp. (ex Lucinoma borealis)]|nr:hypothetical protein [Candidatus Thiodiazotropha sp. (ex Lucinoma borealis)]
GARHDGSTVSPHGYRGLTASAFSLPWRSATENDTILEAYKLFRGLAKEVQLTASKFGIDQIPEYAPIKHGGHEAGEFFFIPQG